MRNLLARHWFLLLLLGGVTLAAAWPDGVRTATDHLPIRVVVALSLGLMSLGLDNRRLLGAVTRPGPAVWAVALSYGALPLLGLLAGQLTPVPDLRIGLLLITAVPCTLASAVLWTRLAGGDEATALLAIVLATSASPLATTGWLVGLTGAAIQVDVGPLMADLFLSLLLPVGAGQLLRAWRPAGTFATRRRGLVGAAAQLLVLSVILKGVAGVSDELTRQGTGPAGLAWAAVLCLAVHLVGFAVGLRTSRLLGIDRARAIAVAFASSQKTLPVSLLLFDAYYREGYPLAVVPPVVYHVGQLIVDTFIAGRLAAGRVGEHVWDE